MIHFFSKILEVNDTFGTGEVLKLFVNEKCNERKALGRNQIRHKINNIKVRLFDIYHDLMQLPRIHTANLIPAMQQLPPDRIGSIYAEYTTRISSK